MAGIGGAIQREIAQGRMAGAVTLVWKAGVIVHVAADGWRDIGANLPMERDSLFRIASMTKPIVSLAALMLVEEGRLSLDTPIARWLPELGAMRVLARPGGPLEDNHPSPRQVTLEDLLTHRSGLGSSYTVTGPLAHAYGELVGAASEPEGWLAALGALPLVRPPGSGFLYGHSTDVLGFLIARAAGKPLGELLRERVFEPLGMQDTAFWLAAKDRQRFARTYRVPDKPGELEDATPAFPNAPPAFESGSGGLVSTADDYLRFARLLLGGGELDGVRLVSRQTVAAMVANRLTDAQRCEPFLGLERFWCAQGFGLGLAITLDPAHPLAPGPGSVGSFGWPGAYGTWWQADPAREMVAIYLVQDFFRLTPSNVGDMIATRRPGARQARLAFQREAYAAWGGSTSPLRPEGM
jgi:CubicO group peptidase (beta-lactamase class C family)